MRVRWRGVAVRDPHHCTLSIAIAFLRADKEAGMSVVWFECNVSGRGFGGVARTGVQRYHSVIVMRPRGTKILIVYNPDPTLIEPFASRMTRLQMRTTLVPSLIHDLFAQVGCSREWRFFACAQRGSELSERCRADCVAFLRSLPECAAALVASAERAREDLCE